MVPQKILALKYLAEQKYGTLTDIQNGSGSKASSEAFRVSLYQFGLSRFSFPNIPHGVWHVQSQALFDELYTYFPNDPVYKVTPVCVNEVEHALGMNRIRRAIFRQLQLNIQAWYSEFYIKALPPPMRFGLSYKLIPDAMFVRSLADGTSKTYFIEYERSLKSPGRYRDIFKSYSAREDVTEGSVIYVCRNERIRNELIRISGRILPSGEAFQFVNFDQLCGDEEKSC